jgi:hypothetical protein
MELMERGFSAKSLFLHSRAGLLRLLHIIIYCVKQFDSDLINVEGLL